MKQYHRYRMDFPGKYCTLSALFMGVSVFLPMLYYLGYKNIEDISAAVLIIRLWLPVSIGIVYMALLRGVRWDAPGLYAIIGALVCAVNIAAAFTWGSAVRGVVETVLYVLCAGILIIVVGGYFPYRLPASLMFGIAIAVRIVFFDLGKLTLGQWIIEAGGICSLIALLLLPMCVFVVKPRK